MELQILSADDVRRIHELLCEEFYPTDRKIDPPGVKNDHLLESAVSRQMTSLGGILKYPDAPSNAASLMYGICCNHPFHNGNKRTALVAMLAHLERNKLGIYGVTDDELEDRVVFVAAHIFGKNHAREHKHLPPWPETPDGELTAISDWLSNRVQRIRRGERPVTYREFRRILAKFDFKLENPKGNSIDVVKYEKRKVGFFRPEIITERKFYATIGYRGREGDIVGVTILKKVRERCRLREEDGVPVQSFYGNEDVISGFINRYRNILRRLANK